MTSRIGTYGSEQLYLTQMNAIQTRMQTEQSQVTTGLTATSYSGIATSADDDLNLQVQLSEANQYVADNSITNTKLSATSSALTGVQSTINNFLDQLNMYAQSNTSNQSQVESLQQQAFNALTAIQSDLGTNIEGQYLFSGGRVSTPPVALPATTLDQFQSIYNGSTTTYPTTRAGDLADLSLTTTQTGAVTFDSSNGLIIPANAGGYSTVPAGATVQVGGTLSNNGTYTVTSMPAMSTGGTMLGETSNIGSSASITWNGGASTLNNAETGNLALSFNSAGQMVVTPSNANTLSNLAAGDTFTIHGSNADVVAPTSTDTTALMGTNLFTYSAGATSASGVTIGPTDQLTLTDSTSGRTYTYNVGSSSTVSDLMNWLNTSTGGSVTASMNNQGQISLVSNGDSIAMGGTLDGLLGFNSTTPISTNSASPTQSSALLDHVNAQTLTSLQSGSGTALVAVGDTMTIGGKTFTVAANSTLTDLTQWMQQQLGSSATVSFTNGQFNIGNASGTTLSGTLVAKMGLTSPISSNSYSGTALPVVPGSYDGAYKVVSANSDGSITIENDTSPSTAETLSASSITLAGGPSLASMSGNASFAISGNTVTLTLPSTPSGGLNGTYSVGSAITLSGTADHNGTYTVSDVTGNTVSFQINPAAVKVSQIIPQTGRSDVTMTFPTTQPDTVANATNPVPGTVLSGTASLDKSVFGSLDFSPNGTGGETISASIPGSLEDSSKAPYPTVGTVITLKSTSGVNDGAYTVVSNDGTHMVVQATTLKSESTSQESTAAPTMTANSWYKGDTLTTQQAVANNQQVPVGIFASDPAFEKAIRALSIIAQGSYGTAGGLENHPERVTAALYLLNSAATTATGGTPPYGPEDPSNIQQLSETVGYTQAVIKTANDSHDTYIGFIQNRLGDIEHADQTTAITTLLADSNALQASYQTLARVSQLTLLNYLPNP